MKSILSFILLTVFAFGCSSNSNSSYGDSSYENSSRRGSSHENHEQVLSPSEFNKKVKRALAKCNEARAGGPRAKYYCKAIPTSNPRAKIICGELLPVYHDKVKAYQRKKKATTFSAYESRSSSASRNCNYYKVVTNLNY